MSIELQIQSNWCWAAVSRSISKFYDANSAWTQCKIVNVALGRSDCCGSGASNRLRCNQPWYLDRALHVTSNLASVKEWENATPPMHFSGVQSQIDKGRVVATRVGWGGGGGHFQAIVGWTVGMDGAEYFIISDPIYKETTILAKDFAATYQAGGDWTHAYLTEPSAASGGGGSIPKRSRKKDRVDHDLVGA